MKSYEQQDKQDLQNEAIVSKTVKHAHAVQLQSAIALHQQGRLAEAEVLYKAILQVQPHHVDALQLLATIAAQQQSYVEAVELFDQVLDINPLHAVAYSNRGYALRELKRYEEAVASYNKALLLKPDYADAYYNCGFTLAELMRYEEASLSYDKAIALRPDYAEAFSCRGFALHELKRYEEAQASFDKAFMLKPDTDFLFGNMMYNKMSMCDWSDINNHLQYLAEKIECRQKICAPLTLLGLLDSPALQKAAAEIFVHERYPASHELPAIQKYARHDKIRIGYFSADFRDHATVYLMAELFEQHDRSKFELIAFSFGTDTSDALRKRAAAAFDRFLDVRSMNDRAVAQLSRTLEVDIAIDLNGLTTHSRPGIFALRAAPVQVNYLGYPGTMGAEYVDYLIADETLIPKESRQYYSEKIVSLPDSYQVNDTTHVIAEKVFFREELGLPATGFVFCCFNNSFKITPSTFDGWMQILRQVTGSVLWLLEDNAVVAGNLRREAVQRGIEAERVIFAKRMPVAEHLARHRVADLFLDTLPCNAHTTASDALWAGLPVLTCIGKSFASRVAASLLNAIHLPELITSSQAEYEAVAINLATNQEQLVKLKLQLEQNRLTMPLFDTQRYARHLEAAYAVMYERHHADLPLTNLYEQALVKR
ncbi:MAG: tetratricopeptide repeat protein [Chlorobium sp.]